MGNHYFPSSPYKTIIIMQGKEYFILVHLRPEPERGPMILMILTLLLKDQKIKKKKKMADVKRHCGEHIYTKFKPSRFLASIVLK